jgi:serine/threonine-protein kinase HipA
MRKANVFVKSLEAGTLIEIKPGSEYEFKYHEKYNGTAVSRTMPITNRLYKFNSFPPFFEGLLPEGILLEGLLKIKKIDRNDFFSQLIAVGEDMVGTVTVKEVTE